jgi:ferritin-like metal-binding protein YciE
MNLETLKELYVNELRDLYNAEGQLIKALPKMAKAAYQTS